MLEGEFRELSNSFSLSSDWLLTASSSSSSTSLRAFLKTNSRITIPVGYTYTHPFFITIEEQSPFLRSLNKFYNSNPLTSSIICLSFSCIFNLSLCTGFSSSTFKYEQLFPILSWPYISSSYYLSSFTTKLLERSVLHVSFTIYAVSFLLLYHSNCSLQGQHHKLVPKSNGYLSVFAFSYFYDSSAINDHSFLSFKIFFKRFYFFLEGGGRKKGRNLSMCQRNIDGLPLTTQACALTRKQTSDLSFCRTTLNPLSHTSQDNLQNLFWYTLPYNFHSTCIFLVFLPSSGCSFPISYIGFSFSTPPLYLMTQGLSFGFFFSFHLTHFLNAYI